MLGFFVQNFPRNFGQKVPWNCRRNSRPKTLTNSSPEIAPEFSWQIAVEKKDAGEAFFKSQKIGHWQKILG
jgi:hypothetical protein